MRNQKICIVRQGYYPGDNRVRKEAEALIDRGYEVDIICIGNRSEKKTENIYGVNICRLPLNRLRGGVMAYLFEYLLFFVLATIKLTALYSLRKYDLIQINTLPDFLVFTAVVPKMFGAGVILDLHEPTPELFIAKFGLRNKMMLKAVKIVERLSIAYADQVITVSEQMKKNYVSRGATADKIDAILNIPDNKRFDFNHFKNDYQVPDKKSFSIVSHGAIIQRYGLELAIKGMAIIQKDIPNVTLNILGYGDPEYIDHLRSIVRNHHLENIVIFHGYLPMDDMIKCIIRADIGIVPVEKNPYSDLVHTNKMFEYVAMKKPVIISRTRAVEEFWGDDDSCVKFFKSGDVEDFAKCAVELYKNPDLAQKMIENAYEKYRRVSWNIAKNHYCDIVENCINKSNKLAEFTSS